MHGIKYGEFNKQALKDAERAFISPEYQNSLERTYQKTRELEKKECRKDDFKLTPARIEIAQCLLKKNIVFKQFNFINET